MVFGDSGTRFTYIVCWLLYTEVLSKPPKRMQVLNIVGYYK